MMQKEREASRAKEEEEESKSVIDKSETDTNEMTFEVPEAELMENSQSYYFDVSASQLTIPTGQNLNSMPTQQ